MSEEFRSPVATSIQYIRLLNDVIKQSEISDATKSQLMGYLQPMNFALTMNLHFTNDVIDFKMIKLGSFEPKHQCFDLVSLIDWVQRLFKNQARL